MGAKFSAIDIGSNAIRMIVGEQVQGNLKLIKKFRAPVRLGRDVFMQGSITDKTLKEALEAFQKFAQINRKYKVQKCRAVATSAVREAQNKQEFVQRIFAESGIKIEIIDGVEEGRLVHHAIKKEINLQGKHILGIDIGGGSVEVTFSESGMMTATESFPMGTVRVLDQMRRRKLTESQLNVVIGEFVNPLMHFIDSHIHNTPIQYAVGTGGNIECMGRLKLQLLKKTPNTYVTVKELAEISELLRKASIAERIMRLDMRPDRADVIVPATMLVETILRLAKIEKMFIPNVGLRDGLLWSMVGG